MDYTETKDGGDYVHTRTMRGSKLVWETASTHGHYYIANAGKGWTLINLSNDNPAIDTEVRQITHSSEVEQPKWTNALRHASLIGYATIDSVRTAVYEVRYVLHGRIELSKYYIDVSDGILRRDEAPYPGGVITTTYYDFDKPINVPDLPHKR